MAEDGAGAIGVEAVKGGGALRGLAAQAQGACGKATVLVDFEGRAEAEDAGPPGALWGGAKDGAIFLLGAWPGGARRPGPCALALVGAPICRYEREPPGDFLPFDLKKLARRGGGVRDKWRLENGRAIVRTGHRATGDRQRDPTRGAGWEFLHIAIDRSFPPRLRGASSG